MDKIETPFSRLESYLATKQDKHNAPWWGANPRVNRVGWIDDDTIGIKQHATWIVKVNRRNEIELNTGGWRTVTTKARINDTLEYLGLVGYGIYQKDWEWYLTSGCFWKMSKEEREAKTVVFASGMKIFPDGHVEGGASLRDVKRRKGLLKNIKRYADGFSVALFNAKVALPNEGDCMYCNMRRANPELEEGPDHLLSHIKAKYYVPSLLVVVLKEVGVSPILSSIVYDMMSLARDRKVYKGDDRGITSVYELQDVKSGKTYKVTTNNEELVNRCRGWAKQDYWRRDVKSALVKYLKHHLDK